ncbi:putative Tubulin-tyrosine ligase [Leptomonas seymouri]|uniref:Tubulin--tyrosine ligase-like protein 5 n=1 Tax=Leptomonas seymouri TaxID=5684 RepID=A0A0N0P7G7_LEPSE|nr:putative Tubulin-tyrosine ligase [Leptomonas seymouri]|eukprot:KPI88776.1 putative Tubulin-tyrosine ligase [Leptomonas seymouri]
MELHAKEAAAAQHARAALQPFLTPPPVVSYPHVPLAAHLPAAAPDETAAVTSTDVLLISSPYPRRRATLAFLPHDAPADGWEHVTRDELGEREPGTHISLVRPDPLPPPGEEVSNTNLIENQKSASLDDRSTAAEDFKQAARPSCHPVLSICRAVPRTSTSPYHRLSYIFGDTCCPFTALIGTLRAAGFTRMEGRRALLHKTHSLLWVKHLMPSTVDQLMGQLAQYRKVNHFPGTHWLGRKDKLCRLMRRAQQRWQRATTANGSESAAGIGGNGCAGNGKASTPLKSPRDPHLAGTASVDITSDAAHSMLMDSDWAALTPPTWVLPQDAKAFQSSLRQSHARRRSLSPTTNVFIVKPANNAGGQGIFLVDAGKDDCGVAAAEAVLVKAGALPKVDFNPAPDAATRDLSNATTSFVVDRTERKNSSSSSSGGGGGQLDGSCFVVQRYMSRPFLLMGHKFDLRLYVVVTSYEPMRMYLYREGLVRIASEAYHAPPSNKGKQAATEQDALADLQQLRAHLTNFTVNKQQATAHAHAASQSGSDEDDSKGGKTEAATVGGARAMESKWPLEALRVYMQEAGYNWSGTQERIHEVLRKTFLSVTPEVRSELHAATRRAAERTGSVDTASSSHLPPPPCTATGIGPFFEFFGVDILLVHDNAESKKRTSPSEIAAAPTLRPVLLEVNILPSLSTHYSLFDQRVKANFIADALTLVGLTSPLFKTAPASPAAPSPPSKHGDTADEHQKTEDWISRTFPADVHAREACYTAAEEQRRAFSFTPLLPTPDSATRYESLMVDSSLGVAAPSRYDAVLSSWAAAQTRPVA